MNCELADVYCILKMETIALGQPGVKCHALLGLNLQPLMYQPRSVATRLHQLLSFFLKHGLMMRLYYCLRFISLLRATFTVRHLSLWGLK